MHIQTLGYFFGTLEGVAFARIAEDDEGEGIG